MREHAVGNFMRRIDNINMVRKNNRIEGRTIPLEKSNLNQTVMTSDIRRRYKNFQRNQRRTAEAERKKRQVARSGDAKEPLQLFSGAATTVDRRQAKCRIRYYLETSGTISPNSTVINFITTLSDTELKMKL